MALLLPAALLGLAFERRASLPGLAVAWLKEGVGAAKVLEFGVPVTVLARRKGRSVSMAAVMIGVDPHKASHGSGDQRGGGAAG